jgi:prepilin-type N-terminal cleavage/methylation domain-containing protein
MKTDRPTIRAGFTLIELLIVMLLMAIMMSMLVNLVQGITGTSRHAATKSTIIKVSRMLEDRAKAFHRHMNTLVKKAGEERFPRYVKKPHWRQAGGRRSLALILARKDEFRRNFPQMFSEDDDYDFNSTTVIPYWPQSDPEYIADNNFPETESSECLYYFLTQGETFGTESITADNFTSNEVMDTDGDGLLEFVDSWGNPLRFYRWPTRLIRPNLSDDKSNVGDSQKVLNPGIPDELKRAFKFKIDEKVAAVILGPLPPRPQFSDPTLSSRFPKEEQSDSDPTLGTELEDSLSRDSDDPLGLTHRAENEGQRFDFWMRPAAFESIYHTPDTYHVPLILSAGPDGVLGIYEPHDGVYDVQSRTYTVSKFGRLAQPIVVPEDPNDPLFEQEARFDNLSNIFLRSGVTR